jgi:hypothetical protein
MDSFVYLKGTGIASLLCLQLRGFMALPITEFCKHLINLSSKIKLYTISHPLTILVSFFVLISGM